MNFKNYLDAGNVITEETQTSLQRVVNDLIRCGCITQTAHWNLRSSAFVAIHPWFGDTYRKLFSIADDVAEQIKIDDINAFVNVEYGNTKVLTDEQELFAQVNTALITVKNSLDSAARDKDVPRAIQSLIDNWTSDIAKMIWFIKASTK